MRMAHARSKVPDCQSLKKVAVRGESLFGVEAPFNTLAIDAQADRDNGDHLVVFAIAFFKTVDKPIRIQFLVSFVTFRV